MSAFVCTHNRTYSCIIELAMKHETITNPDLLAQRLYLLNVESVNQRYDLKKSAPDEYKEYMTHLADIHYEPQPNLHDAQRVQAARCWMYQSCEGDCMKDALYKAVECYTGLVMYDLAKKVAGEVGMTYHPKDAASIVYRYLDKHEELENTWE